MPPDAPPCPACHATETERLPFTITAAEHPVFLCLVCGQVWPPLPRLSVNGDRKKIEEG